ncbi:MAG: hypothetical protein MZV65_41890 [Chromatiales bacterium]|nr:hypothetical protein [Chromatiales bacterium]
MSESLSARAFIRRVNEWMGDEYLVPGDNGEFRIITELEDPKNPRIEPERLSPEEVDSLWPDEQDALLEFVTDCALSFPCTIEQARLWAGAVLGLEFDPGERPVIRSSGVTPHQARVDLIRAALAEHGVTALTAQRGLKQRIGYQVAEQHPRLFGPSSLNAGGSFDKAWSALRDQANSENSESSEF